MNRIIAYQIVEETGQDDLETTVRAEIKAGWEPHGSPVLLGTHRARNYFAQAMVKYDRSPEKVDSPKPVPTIREILAHIRDTEAQAAKKKKPVKTYGTSGPRKPK